MSESASIIVNNRFRLYLIVINRK